MGETRRIRYVDIGSQYREHREELLAAVDRVLASGDYILGAEVEAFEASFAALCGTPYAIAVANGTDAMVLAMMALGIGSGDEVITAPNSFLASASSIALAGARPVFADIREDYNLDPAAVEAAITPRTRAILVVHLTGRPADMNAFADIARRHHLALIEDAAQAVGANYHGRVVGSLGDVGCFSLHPLKNLNACGDAGVVTVRDAALATRLAQLRNHGLMDRNRSVQWAPNSRLDGVQAAILNVRLRLLPDITRTRRSSADYYQRSLPSSLGIPRDRAGEEAVYHTFVVTVADRDGLAAHLARLGVDTKIHYPVPLHLQPAAHALGYRAGDFPRAEWQADHILSLPIGQHLSQADLDYVVASVCSFTSSNAGRIC